MKNYLSFFLISLLFIGGKVATSASAGAPAPGSAAAAAAALEKVKTKKNKIKLPLGVWHRVFKNFGRADLNKYKLCSKELYETICLCESNLNQIDLIKEVDRFIAKKKIVEAERLLRPYIARYPSEYTPISLLNRYILLLHSELWPNEKYKELRYELFNLLKAKAHAELAFFVKKRGASAQKPEISAAFKARLDALVLNNEKKPAIIIGDKFLNNKFPVKDLEQIKRVCKQRDGLRAAKAGGNGGSGGGGAVADETPKVPSFDYLQGIQPATNGFTSVSAHELRPCYQEHINNAEATCLLAYFLYKDGQFSEAVELLNQAALYAPRAALVHWVTGVLQHYHFQDFNQSCHAYTRAITLASDFAYPYYSLAVLCSDGREFEIANLLYRHCLNLDPSHHYARMNQAIALDEQNPEVLEQYRKIMEIHPTEMYVYRAVARLLLKRQQQPAPEPVSAEPVEPQVVPVGPHEDDVREAQAVLENAISIDPRGDGGGHWLDLGFLHLRHRHNTSDAITCFRKFIEVAEDRELADRVVVLVQQLRAQLPQAYSEEEGDDLTEEDD